MPLICEIGIPPKEKRTPSFSLGNDAYRSPGTLGCPASRGHCNEEDWRKPLCTATKLSRVCHQANQESLGPHSVNGLDQMSIESWVEIGEIEVDHGPHVFMRNVVINP